MARKKKLKIPPYIKLGLIGLCVLIAGFIIMNRTLVALKNIEYFNVQSIVIDSSLGFIDKRDLRGVIGKNIFEVNIERIQRQLNHKYPQASELKVNRQFPNQISVVAKKRLAFAQVKIRNNYAILDKEGIVLSQQSKKDKNLPDIIASNLGNPKVVLGLALRGSDLSMALRIIRTFLAEESLAVYSLASINIENLSNIRCTLTNGIYFIIDRDNMNKKIGILGVVLAQNYLTLKDIQYVDLRFKDPTIGKK